MGDQASALEPAPRRLAAFLVLSCLILGAYLPLLCCDRALYYRDITSFFYWTEGLQHSTQASAWHPGWETGFPLAAHPLFQASYPPKLALFRVLPFPLAYWLLFALHSLCAGVGAFELALRLGSDGRGALLAGICFAVGGSLLGVQSDPNLFFSACLLPTLALATLVVCKRPRLPGIALLGVVCTLMVQVSVQIFVLGCAFSVMLALSHIGRRLLNRRSLLGFGLGLGLGALLSLPIMIPVLQLVGRSNRTGQLRYEAADVYSMPPLRSVEFVLPRPFGGADDYTGPRQKDRAPFVTDLYLGLPVLFCVLLAVGRKRWDLAFLLAAAVLSWLVAMGDFVGLFRLVHALPLFGRFRVPEKYLLITGLALALLAGLGITHLRRSRGLKLWLRLAATVAIGCAALTLVYRMPRTALSTEPGLLALHVVASSVLLVLIALHAGPRRSLWLLAIAAIGLCSVNRQAVYTIEAEVLRRRSAAADSIAVKLRSAEPFRIDSRGFEHVRIPIGLEFKGAHEGVYAMAIDQLRFSSPIGQGLEIWDAPHGMRSRRHHELSRQMKQSALLQRNMLRVFNVRFHILPPRFDEEIPAGYRLHSEGESFVIWEDSMSVARASLPSRILPAASLATAMRLLSDTSFVPGEELVVEGVEERESCGSGEILQTAWNLESVQVEVEMRASGWLFLAFQYAPGWRATVDGQPVQVYQGNGLGAALRVPSGSHVIALEYTERTRGVTWAAMLCGLLGWVIAVALFRRRFPEKAR